MAVSAPLPSAPHHQIVEAQKHLKGGERCDPMWGQASSQVLAIFVSPASLPRALRIMDALIKAWGAAGGSVTIDQDPRDQGKYNTHFRMADDKVAAWLDEIRQCVPGTRRGRLGKERETDYTGRLAFRLSSAYESKVRATWADGVRQNLDDLLDSVVAGLLRRMEYEKQHRRDDEIKARQKQRAIDRREGGRRKEAQGKQLREELKNRVGRWQYAQQIRQFLSELEAKIADGRLRANDEQGFARWLRWARRYADQIDPLVLADPLPEETHGPVNTPLADIELTNYARPILERLDVRDTDALYRLGHREIVAAAGDRTDWAWNEACRVLEGLGYDVSDRRYYM